MDFLWFQDLSHLARTGHFSRAAEMSNISQPAFSRRIRALEDWAGVTLVDRARHPVTLTSPGLQLLEAGLQALDRLETERREIQEAQAQPESYVVTFGAQHSIGWRFYPTWLQGFEDSFGPIMSRLRADDLQDCVAALMKREIDFVIAYSSHYAHGIANRPDIESVRIGKDALIPVCKCNADGTPIYDLSPDSSVQIPYLQFGPNAPISQHIEPHLSQHGLHDSLRTVYENSMAGALRIRARDGAGVAWLPRSLIAPDLENGQLAVLPRDAWQVPLEIRLYRFREHTNRLTRGIWGYLQFRRG
ncbi:MAG: LysR substrate-binding domain-containing protein [Pseudomonadota bacterium]